MEASVIENMLDFIIRAADDLWGDQLSPDQQVKYSTIELYTAIELLMKARLMQEHWSLILANSDRYVEKYKKDEKCFEKGDFQSISYETGRGRLAAFCNVELDQQVHQSFNDLRKLRNRYVHFSCNEARPRVIGIQLRAWHHVLRRLEEGFLNNLADQHKALLEVAREKMLRSEEFLSARFKEVQSEIERAKHERGCLAADCPTCGERSLLIGDGFPSCPVCGNVELYPTFVADAYATANNPSWKHPKDGIDDELAYCDVCGYEAGAPVGDDLLDDVLAKLAKHPREPGDDSKIYICFACGEPICV